LKKYSVKNICEDIWELEENYDLFNKKISGVYFWKLVRFKIFKKILENKKTYNKVNSKDKSFVKKIEYLLNIIKNYYLYGSLRRKEKKDLLIFESARKKNIDGEYIDIYTNHLVDKFNDLKLEYELIDSAYNGKHYNNPSEIRSFNDYFSFFDFIKYKILKINLSKNEKELINIIKSEIKNKVKVDIYNLENLIKKSISDFLYQYKYYKKLLTRRNPKKIYLVCSYGKEALIEASRCNDIRVVEIQHGTINKYHLGYSFPNHYNIPYFPDRIKMFGEYWYESSCLPLSKKDIDFNGYPYMENRIKKYSKESVEKKINEILFISQDIIGKKLSKIAYKFAENNKDYNIIYKLHPKEYKIWEKEYLYLVKAKKLNNFHIIESDKIDLYRLFFRAEYLVGVSSTAIYEGLIIGCKTILVDLPSIEYMEYLLKNNYVKIVNNHKEINGIIREDDFDEINRSYFFSNI